MKIAIQLVGETGGDGGNGRNEEVLSASADDVLDEEVDVLIRLNGNEARNRAGTAAQLTNQGAIGDYERLSL